MLVDQASINLKSGRGGDGKVSFARSKKPSGGDGGRGGDIVLVGSIHEYDLRDFRHAENFKAENGLNGGDEQKTGRRGETTIIKVPLSTLVYGVQGVLLTTISEDGQVYLATRGGEGGLGNWNFRSGQFNTLRKSTKGKPGGETRLKLVLVIQADVVLIGLPNAGKSSLLNSLTNAQAKVAPYQFTTLEPHLGTIDKLVIMDFPGLIENTYLGKGLGPKFFQHANSAKVVAHILSLAEEDIVSCYKTIRTELQNVSPELAAKPELLILSKSDTQTESELAAKIKQAKKLNKNFIITSISEEESIEALSQKLVAIFE